jgi:hypothetical protein
MTKPNEEENLSSVEVETKIKASFTLQDFKEAIRSMISLTFIWFALMGQYSANPGNLPYSQPSSGAINPMELNDPYK